jgi:uncharacterized protein YndB with AHSA1/START domain
MGALRNPGRRRVSPQTLKKAKPSSPARRRAPTGRISEDAVLAATGRGWTHWLGVLDRFGRNDGKTHREAAAHLEERHALSGWWSQMVTVEYERQRGIRAVNQRGKGFGVDVQRTIAAPASRVFQAFSDAKALSLWLATPVKHDFRKGGRYSDGEGDRGEYLAIDAPRRLRLSWENPKRAPGSVVEFTFTPKGRGKTVVRVSHECLPDAKGVTLMRGGWSWALHSLRTYLATGKGVPFAEWDAAGRP